MNERHSRARAPGRRMRTLLICHDGAVLSQEGIARWLASFSDLAGMVVLQERKARKWQRVRREIRRSGALGFLDVIAFRLYSAVFLARKERGWVQERLEDLRRRYPPLPEGLPRLITHSPNSEEARRFIADLAPDIAIARCKVLLQERIFSLPRKGTFVMHPGICPQYRNAHGCFWALVQDDRENVGMTLLKVDSGVDTGPVYAYHRVTFDEARESPSVIQHRVVLDSLDLLREDLQTLFEGHAAPIPTEGKPSAAWGQPRLTRYWRWKSRARREKR